MSSLLHIPREIRDQILNLLINTPPLPVPSTTNLTLSNRQQRVLPPERFSPGSNILYPPFPPRTSTSLLLVNHQLRHETLTALQRLPTSYIIDIILYQECQLWPTWLSLPRLSTNIEKVYTTIRIAGFPPFSEDESNFTGFTQGCGGPPWIEWCFLEVWKDLLKGGPTGKATSPSGVKVLELDVISPDADLIVASLDIDPGDLPELRESTGIDYILNPVSILGTIEYGLDKLLLVEYYAEEYGGCLYEGLGTVRLLHDGVLKREWNVTEMFANLRFMDEKHSRVPIGDRVASFEKWRDGIRETRMQVGLLDRKTGGGIAMRYGDGLGYSRKGKNIVARSSSCWKIVKHTIKTLLL